MPNNGFHNNTSRLQNPGSIIARQALARELKQIDAITVKGVKNGATSSAINRYNRTLARNEEQEMAMDNATRYGSTQSDYDWNSPQSAEGLIATFLGFPLLLASPWILSWFYTTMKYLHLWQPFKWLVFSILGCITNVLKFLIPIIGNFFSWLFLVGLPGLIIFISKVLIFMIDSFQFIAKLFHH